MQCGHQVQYLTQKKKRGLNCFAIIYYRAEEKKCVAAVFSLLSVCLLTSNKQLNPPSSCYFLLKGVTLCLQVGGVAIEDVRVLCFYIYVLEEVIPHEGVVALRMISGKSYKRSLWQFLMQDQSLEASLTLYA